MRHDLKPIIDDIVTDMRAVTERGTVASYIPGLACADPNRFGIAVVTAEGEVILGGDAEIGFSIQSISKVFTLTLARVPTGDCFALPLPAFPLHIGGTHTFTTLSCSPSATPVPG